MTMYYVKCQDGMVRHARPFDNRDDAAHWAEWNHMCTKAHDIRAAADLFHVGDVVSELLVTDTRAYEVISRTDAGSLTLRRMVPDPSVKPFTDHMCDAAPNGLSVMWQPVAACETASTLMVRLRKDGTYRTGQGANALKPCAIVNGFYVERVDYRF